MCKSLRKKYLYIRETMLVKFQIDMHPHLRLKVQNSDSPMGQFLYIYL
jgi:hypothetical protein